MVDAVSSFSPSAYLNQIKGISKTPAVSSQPPKPEEVDNAPGNTAGSSTGNGKPQSNPFQIPPEALSVLQGVSSGSQNGSLISEIVGSSSANASDAFSGVYGTLLQSASSTEPLQQALSALQQRKADTATQFSTLPSVLGNYHAGLNAYNKVLQQNAQAVLDESKKPIVA